MRFSRDSRFNGLGYLCVALLGMYMAAYQSAVDSVALEFRMDAFQMGFLVTAYFVGSMASPPLMGAIAGRSGMRTALGAALFLAICDMALMAFSTHWVPFCAGVILVGFGFSAIESLITSALAAKNPGAVERVVNRSQMWYCIGAVVSGPALNRLVTAGLGWRSGFYLLIPAFFALGLGFLRLQSAERPSVSDREAGPMTIPKPFLIFICMAMALYVGVEQGVAFFIGTHFAELQQSALSAAALSGFWGGMILGRLAGGHMSFDHQRLARWGILACIPLMLLLNFTTGGIAVGIFALAGLLLALCWPLLATMVANRCTGSSALAMGWLAASGACGGAAIPPLIGYLTRLGGTGMGFLLVAGLLGGIIAFMHMGNRRDCR